MEMCYEYSIKWRYEFNHIKSGVVTFGECKLAHYENMNNEREWLLGDESVDELYEYKNLGPQTIQSNNTRLGEYSTRTTFDTYVVNRPVESVLSNKLL